MKKLLVIAIGMLCATAIMVQAEGTNKVAKTERTPEQKALWKEIVTKYDINKDGKLDNEEKAKISKEDKEKLEKAGLGNLVKEHKEKKDKHAAPVAGATNATAVSTNAAAN
jgi:hypothetical protein